MLLSGGYLLTQLWYLILQELVQVPVPSWEALPRSVLHPFRGCWGHRVGWLELASALVKVLEMEMR